MKKKIFFTIAFVVFATLIFSIANAQCPMCGEAARTSLKEGNTTAIGLNTGILYLLLAPYILLMIGFVSWYRHRKKVRNLLAAEQ